MRERINAALKQAVEAGDKRRTATLRLICTAISDRAGSARDQGRDGVSSEEILDILQRMIRQREKSSTEFEQAGQLDLAQQERDETEVIREFLPKQFGEEEVREACASVVNDLDAHGLRDMGRTMNALKERYPDQMDFARASCVVKDMLLDPAPQPANDDTPDPAPGR